MRISDWSSDVCSSDLIIFNTLNGDSNVAFFKQMAAAGLTPKVIPVMSFSIGEQEAQAMGPALVEGSYAAWNYFQTLDGDANAKFIKAYKAKFGEDKRSEENTYEHQSLMLISYS